jgi:hypothetical protein
LKRKTGGFATPVDGNFAFVGKKMPQEEKQFLLRHIHIQNRKLLTGNLCKPHD